jgi:hypothetical protein
MTHDRVMTVELDAPRVVADAPEPLCRADDVGEQHGGEDAVVRGCGTRPRQELLDERGAVLDIGVEVRVDARERGEARVRDVVREVATVLEQLQRLHLRMTTRRREHERRCLHEWQQVAHVVALVEEHRRRGARARAHLLAAREEL